MNYLLLFDIGNTNIKIGLADKNSVLRSFALPTGQDHTADSLGLLITQAIAQSGFGPRPAAILASSVVPRLDPLLRRACEIYLDSQVIFVPEDQPVPLRINYDRPSEIGSDRLVGAYAARRLYPEYRSLIVVDYGTATTVECVVDNTYWGGLICPGVLSSANALATRTAKLPGVSLEVEAEKPLPVTSTSMCINHGFVFGFAAMTEGLCARIMPDLEPPVFVLGTGGFAASIARVSNCFNAVRPDLLLDGLRMLYALEA